jgi:hypothetical protein
MRRRGWETYKLGAMRGNANRKTFLNRNTRHGARRVLRVRIEQISLNTYEFEESSTRVNSCSDIPA